APDFVAAIAHYRPGVVARLSRLEAAKQQLRRDGVLLRWTQRRLRQWHSPARECRRRPGAILQSFWSCSHSGTHLHRAGQAAAGNAGGGGEPELFQSHLSWRSSGLGQDREAGATRVCCCWGNACGFGFPEESEIWIPDYDFLVSPWGASRTGHNFRVVGLTKPNVSLAQAQAEMTTIGARLAKAYPNDDAKKSVAVTPLHDELVKKVRTTLYLLLG